MRRFVVRCTAAALLVATAAHAEEPWSERVIGAHVDQSTLSGTLDAEALEALRDAGERLFVGRFTEADGVGRPMATQAIVPTKRKRPPAETFVRSAGLDAGSCAACHNQPVDGGAGDFVTNVFTSEGFESADFDSLDPQFSNERGTNHLMGAGLVELLAREMTVDLQAVRAMALKAARESGQPVTQPLETKGVNFGSITVGPDGLVDISGIEGVDADLVLRPFSQKGVMTSLRQFTVNALNHHHGMQAVERFGARWTGEADFDGDGKENEISDGDVSAMVAWQAGLEPPVRLQPQQPAWREASARGEDVFADLGCGECHIPALPLASLKFADPGPLDMAGTLREGELAEVIYDLELLAWAASLPRNEKGEVLVPLFGDLKRHVIADQEVATLGNELLAQRFVERNVFMTAELWGVGSTDPYGHRNDITSLDGIIRAHGGEGRAAREAYIAAAEQERSDLIAFLKTLVIDQ
jgi:hypothetical protein